MTVFRAYQYQVGGLSIHGGEEETHYDHIPDEVMELWDRDGDLWHRAGEDEWAPVDADYEGTWSTSELLDEFGPVTDEEHHGLRRECPHCLLELVDELHVRSHLP